MGYRDMPNFYILIILFASLTIFISFLYIIYRFCSCFTSKIYFYIYFHIGRITPKNQVEIKLETVSAPPYGDSLQNINHLELPTYAEAVENESKTD